MTSGSHAVEVPCWRASDRSSLLNDEVLRYHTGLTPELSDPRYILDRGAAIACGTGADPSSVGPYASENLDIYGFKLTDDEVATLSKIKA